MPNHAGSPIEASGTGDQATVRWACQNSRHDRITETLEAWAAEQGIDPRWSLPVTWACDLATRIEAELARPVHPEHHAFGPFSRRCQWGGCDAVEDLRPELEVEATARARLLERVTVVPTPRPDSPTERLAAGQAADRTRYRITPPADWSDPDRWASVEGRPGAVGSVPTEVTVHHPRIPLARDVVLVAAVVVLVLLGTWAAALIIR